MTPIAIWRPSSQRALGSQRSRSAAAHGVRTGRDGPRRSQHRCVAGGRRGPGYGWLQGAARRIGQPRGDLPFARPGGGGPRHGARAGRPDRRRRRWFTDEPSRPRLGARRGAGQAMPGHRTARLERRDQRGRPHHRLLGGRRAAQSAALLLERELAQADLSGLATPVEQRLAEGLPGGSLVEASATASMVVVGSRGHRSLTGLLLGSVSDQVAHHAQCAVVVVPPSAVPSGS